jgi:glutaredoxin-like YruB-family protein
MKSITTQTELNALLQANPQLAVLFYKRGSDNSECAFRALLAEEKIEEAPLYGVNVAEAEPLHKEFGITTVPTLLMLSNGQVQQVIKGCHQPEVLEQLLKKSSGVSSTETRGQQVTVYSTPSCPHCTSLKNYLKQLQVSFRDINIASDAQKAQALVQQTGQQGVPQVQINGQWVLGFDKAKIDQLLKK